MLHEKFFYRQTCEVDSSFCVVAEGVKMHASEEDRDLNAYDLEERLCVRDKVFLQ